MSIEFKQYYEYSHFEEIHKVSGDVRCMKKFSNVEIDISEYSISPSSIHELSASASLLSQLCPNFSKNAILLVLFIRGSVVRPGENLNSGSLNITVHIFPYFSIPLLMYPSSSEVNSNGLRILTESLLF